LGFCGYHDVIPLLSYKAFCVIRLAKKYPIICWCGVVFLQYVPDPVVIVSCLDCFQSHKKRPNDPIGLQNLHCRVTFIRTTESPLSLDVYIEANIRGGLRAFSIQIIAPDSFFADFIMHYDFSRLPGVFPHSFVLQFTIVHFFQTCCIYHTKNLLLRSSDIIFTYFCETLTVKKVSTFG
jgi:hypothetical protein